MTPPRASQSAFSTEPMTSPTAPRPSPYSVVPHVVRDGQDGQATTHKETALEAPPEFDPRNLFLAALSPTDQAILRSMLSLQRLPQGLVLQEPEQSIEHVYFVESGMISLVAAMQDGAAIETVTLGREAILGALAAFGTHRATARAIVQIDATAWRLPVADFRHAIEESPGLRKMALLGSELLLAHMQQTAACNALHTAERRLCRWIV